MKIEILLIANYFENFGFHRSSTDMSDICRTFSGAKWQQEMDTVTVKKK